MDKLDFYSSSFKISICVIFTTAISVIIAVITGYKEYALYAIFFGLGAATVGISLELEKILLILVNNNSDKS